MSTHQQQEKKVPISNRYALEQPSNFYLKQFLEQESKRQLYPQRPYGYYSLNDSYYIKVATAEPDSLLFFEDDDKVYSIIGDEHADFEIYLKSSDGRIALSGIQLAQAVLAQITEMDKQVRRTEGDFDYAETLFYIDLSEEEIRLHYAATIVNTEWSAYFTRNQDGKFSFLELG